MVIGPNGNRKRKSNERRTTATLLHNKKKYPYVHKLGEIFDEHIKCGFQKHDLEAAMKTMVKEPYVHLVPVLTGGIGYSGVYNFYKNEFIGKMPDDTKFVRISRTIGKDQVVDEVILSKFYS
jgi:carboxymethylenebutenolidase